MDGSSNYDDNEVEISSLSDEDEEPQRQMRVDLTRVRLTTRQRARRFALTLGAITLGLAIILITSILPQARRADTTQDPNAAIFLQAEGKFCARDSAWSPDSKRLAIVGTYGNTCNVVNKITPGEVGILDARNGQRLSTYHPDAAIMEAASKIQTPAVAPTSGALQLEYDDVVWSAKGDQLALTFILSGARPFQTYDGLAVLTLRSGATQVYLHTTPRSFNQVGYFIWDLTTGASTFQKPWSTTGDYRVDLAPASAYSWNDADMLVPNTALRSGGGSPGPIGNPIGGTAFSAWQRGVLVALRPAQDTGFAEPPVYVFTATINVWSPDGRYFIEAAHLSGRVVDTEQTPIPRQYVDLLQLQNNPTLPIRDQCLLTAIDNLPAPTIPPYATGSTLAWSPDGRFAALSLPTGVGLIDCRTGNVLHTYINEAPHDVYTPMQSFLWSPDGKWLLIQPMDAIVNIEDALK